MAVGACAPGKAMRTWSGLGFGRCCAGRKRCGEELRAADFRVTRRLLPLVSEL